MINRTLVLPLTSKHHKGRCGNDFSFFCGVVLLISFCILTKEFGFYCDILQMHDVKIHQEKVASIEDIIFLHVIWFMFINDDSRHMK